MLTLSQAQLDHLQQLEAQGFVVRVRDQILEDDAEQLKAEGEANGTDDDDIPPGKLAQDPTLLPRLQSAKAEADRLGFAQTDSIVQFLYLEAYAPGFYKNPQIQAWLTKPGKPVEGQFSDLLETTQNTQQRQNTV